ncbi:MAG: hypothetical protein ACXWPM_08390, partial [Bdellovibrionota bacterium]
SGVVKDLQGKALQGTEVFFRNKSVAMTGTDGTYAVRFVGNAAELTGSKIRFSKLLFKAAVAEALTESELTRSSCTKVLLTRDAVLKPLR